ncbi:MAG: hypothetical protein DRJ66_00600 [Thermoprotei archaeon]|nr:MAG: hypothetical protein DRJ66_00600 [Thermoprotei archaeon]RLF19444.1 MAG: hypothetical protein DRZ82_05735 [Thermoprotei archaeon]
MRVLEALLIVLIMTTINAYALENRTKVIIKVPHSTGEGRVLAWLDLTGILKKVVYSKRYDELTEILLLILKRPFVLEIYDVNGTLLFKGHVGDVEPKKIIVYILPGVNGSFDPRIIVLRV